MSPHFSCYGETTIATPNIDRLTAEGTRFTHAYITAPVCSTCRSALITSSSSKPEGAHAVQWIPSKRLYSFAETPIPLLDGAKASQ
jgi:arylsulfatase A-like enzyme